MTRVRTLLAISFASLFGAFAAQAEAFVYWPNNSSRTIGRAAFDGNGTNQSFVSAAGVGPQDIAVDGEHIYWVSYVGGVSSNAFAIGRANIDGSAPNVNFIDLTPDSDEASGLAVHGQYIYWTDGYALTVGRAKLDGTDVEEHFISTGGRGNPAGVAVTDDYIYWADYSNGTIGRANLDGTHVDASFITGLTHTGDFGGPSSLAVDGSHIYWSSYISGTIGRANLDGTGVNQSFIAAGKGAPSGGDLNGVAVDGSHIYWSDGSTNDIGRANLDGTGINSAFITGASGPVGVAVDPAVTPSLSSTATGTATLGAPISDIAAVSSPAGPTGNVTFAAYGPDDPTCSGPPAFTSAPVSLSSGIATTSFTPTALGTYRWIASYGGDDGNASVAGRCGDTGETSTIVLTAPSISTTASTGTLGGSISDTATISGGVRPTGTITFKLYGPGDSACSTALTTLSATVNSGNGTYSSGGFTAAQAGTYRWVASYSGDANNAPASGGCGDPGESVEIAPASTTTTIGSSQNPSVAGQAVTLTATVTGHSPTGTVTFTDGSSALGSATLGASGTATLSTSALGVGSHAITASYGGDQNNAASASASLTEVVTAPRRGGPPSNAFTASHIVTHADGTVTFDVTLPGRGTVDVLETAWLDNFAHVAQTLPPAPRRFVYSRKHIAVSAAGTIHVTVRPNKRGARLVAHHRYTVLLRLWISFTPSGGVQRDQGFYGLRIPDADSLSYVKPPRVNRSP